VRLTFGCYRVVGREKKSVFIEDLFAEVEEGEDGEGCEPAGEDEVLGVAKEVEAGGFAVGAVEEDVFDEEPAFHPNQKAGWGHRTSLE